MTTGETIFIVTFCKGIVLYWLDKRKERKQQRKAMATALPTATRPQVLLEDLRSGPSR